MGDFLKGKPKPSQPSQPVITILFFGSYKLVGGLNPSEKYESQLEWWDSQYMGK